ncbi:ANKS1A, partial [Symbiodinium sp. KB8]
MAPQAGADLLGAEKRRLLDRTLGELQEMCRHPCDNLDCDERQKFGDVTDNARVKCSIVCLQKKKDVTDYKQTPRQIFELNRQNIRDGKKSKILHISIQCASCGEEGAVVRLQDTVEKLYLDLRQYLANDKAQPLLYRPGQPNEDIPDDAKAVCELTHRPCVDDFAKNHLTSEAIQSILRSLQPGHELYNKLRAKGVKAHDKFGDRTMTYIRIGLGLLELGQYTAVLELWPKGYKSPKHHHGGCAGSVRVLYGALNCQLFDSILDDEPIKFKGDDGQLDLPNEDQTVLKLTTGNTTWLNRQNWWVHQVQCHDDFDFALSVHLYKSCSDAFAFMKPTTGHTEAAALTQVEGARALEKGMPNNDYFWNISLPASDERVKEIGCPAGSGQSAGPLDFEKHVLNEAHARALARGQRQANYAYTSQPSGPSWRPEPNAFPPEHQGCYKAASGESCAQWTVLASQARCPQRERIRRPASATRPHYCTCRCLRERGGAGRWCDHRAKLYRGRRRRAPQRCVSGVWQSCHAVSHWVGAESWCARYRRLRFRLWQSGVTALLSQTRQAPPHATNTLFSEPAQGRQIEVSAHWAALNGHKEVLHDMAPETLSSKNDDGEVPAHLAARNGHKEALQLLHDLAPETLSSKSNDGRVPAHLAARNGHKEVLQLLHDLAPETLSSKNNRGVVPAHLAAHNGHKEALQLLHDLAPGTLSSKDNDGEVPAHCAASNGHKEALQLLHDLAFGTLSSKNNDGEVPAHWAALNGHKEALQLLHDL